MASRFDRLLLATGNGAVTEKSWTSPSANRGVWFRILPSGWEGATDIAGDWRVSDKAGQTANAGKYFPMKSSEIFAREYDQRGLAPQTFYFLAQAAPGFGNNTTLMIRWDEA